MKRVLGEPAALAVLGEIDAGENADRRADEHREADHDHAADDRVRETACAAGRRRHLGEEVERRPPTPRRITSKRIHASQKSPNTIAASDSASAMRLVSLRWA